MSCQIYKISVFKLADFSHRSCLYRVSHPFVDNFWLNFLFIKTTYLKSKICFKIFVKKSFRWQIEYQKNVSNSKKKNCTMPASPQTWCNFFLEFDTFFWYSIKKNFQFNFPRFQGAIWKIFFSRISKQVLLFEICGFNK